MVQLKPDATSNASAKAGRRGATGAGKVLYLRLRDQIADGTLPAGGPAPSSRGLAAELGLSRTTVTTVFEQLAAEGYLLTAKGRVARIANPLASMPQANRGAAGISMRPTGLAPMRGPGGGAGHGAMLGVSAFARRLQSVGLPTVPPAEPAAYDFLYGAVAYRDFPARAWRRAYQAALLQQQVRLYYAAPEGDAALLAALQGYLRRARGLVCEAGQIIVVHGSQQGLDLCARLLLDTDCAFTFEDPGYLMARRCFEATGARGLATPVDALGLMTEALPIDRQVRLAYVTPSHQFPLGGVLPITRRHALLQWARRQNAWVVEDDYDGEFRYGQRPIDALQSIDSDGRVIYVGTFSKALSPQMRLGYLVVPPALVDMFRSAKRLADRHAPVLEQRVLATLIESGIYERHVRRMRRDNERRRAALLEAVARYLPAGAQVGGTAAGLHGVLWLPFLLPADEPALVHQAREAGVGLYPVSPMFALPESPRQPRPAGFMVGYASLSVAQIRQGMQILGRVLTAFVR